MHLEIHSDLNLEFEGHELSLRNEGDNLVAEFSSLTALRLLRRKLPLKTGPLPKALRLPGLEGFTTMVVVRGRTIAILTCSEHSARVRPSWWSLLATLLHLPGG